METLYLSFYSVSSFLGLKKLGEEGACRREERISCLEHARGEFEGPYGQ